LLFVESPPLFIGYAARYLSKRWGCPFILNVSDLWPESAVRMGVVKRGLLFSLAERLELSLYGDAAGVTGQSSEIIDSVRRRSPGTRTAVITNGVDCSRFGRDRADASARNLLGPEPGPVFLYAGLLGLAQGLDQILELAKSLPEQAPGRFVLVGEGPERARLEKRIQEERIARVKIAGPQPRDRIPALLASADAAVITLGMSIPGAVPSKIYEAMASERPILLVADGEAARRVEEAQCGLTTPPRDSRQLMRALTRLATDQGLRDRLGAAGREAAVNVYNRSAIAGRLDQFLSSCLPGRAPQSAAVSKSKQHRLGPAEQAG
jgi:glycosyltransferase involved in cell wall biosynthesis